MRKFTPPKDIIKRVKIKPTEWEKIFANHVSDKGLIPRTYREHLKLSNNNHTQSNSKVGKGFAKTFLPRRYRQMANEHRARHSISITRREKQVKTMRR